MNQDLTNNARLIVGTHIPDNAKPAIENYATPSKERWFHSKDGFFCLPRAIREDTSLSNAEFRVLVCLASFVFLKDEATPSLETLNRYCGMTEGTISKATSKLEEKGWVRKVKRPYTSVLYTLVLPEQYKKNSKLAPQQLELPVTNTQETT